MPPRVAKKPEPGVNVSGVEVGPVLSVSGDMAFVLEGVVGDPIPGVEDGWYLKIRVRSNVPLKPGERVSVTGLPLIGHGNNTFRVSAIAKRH